MNVDCRSCGARFAIGDELFDGKVAEVHCLCCGAALPLAESRAEVPQSPADPAAQAVTEALVEAGALPLSEATSMANAPRADASDADEDAATTLRIESRELLEPAADPILPGPWYPLAQVAGMSEAWAAEHAPGKEAPEGAARPSVREGRGPLEATGGAASSGSLRLSGARASGHPDAAGPRITVSLVPLALPPRKASSAPSASASPSVAPNDAVTFGAAQPPFWNSAPGRVLALLGAFVIGLWTWRIAEPHVAARRAATAGPERATAVQAPAAPTVPGALGSLDSPAPEPTLLHAHLGAGSGLGAPSERAPVDRGAEGATAIGAVVEAHASAPESPGPDPTLGTISLPEIAITADVPVVAPMAVMIPGENRVVVLGAAAPKSVVPRAPVAKAEAAGRTSTNARPKAQADPEDTEAPSGAYLLPDPVAPAHVAFDEKAARTAMDQAAKSAARCKTDDFDGVAKVAVTFAPSGRATTAVIEGPPYAGTSRGGCIAATFRALTVPPFSGPPITVRRSF